MNDTNDAKAFGENLVRQAEEIEPFTAAFREFIRGYFPDYPALLRAADEQNHQLIVSNLQSLVSSIRRDNLDENRVTEMIKSGQTDQLLLECSTIKAAQILLDKCRAVRNIPID